MANNNAASANLRTAVRTVRAIGQLLPHLDAPITLGRPTLTPLQAETARRAAKLTGVTRRSQADFDRYRDLLARTVAHRRPPSLAQLATATVVAAGSGLNLIGTVLSGGTWDPGLFDDGLPWAGDPVPAPSLESASGGTGPRRLQDLAALVIQARTAPLPAIGVTRVTNPGRPARFIVSVPGTQQPLGLVADRRPFDGTGNLRAMAGQSCTTAAAIALALDRAGVPEGAELLLNGHSQGGIQSAVLASDRAFTARYHAELLVAYGAPIEGFAFDDQVEVIALCNPTDWIQALDLKAVGLERHPRDGGRFVEYWLPGPTRPATGPLLDHGMPQYVDAISREEGTGGALDELLAAKNIARFLVAEGGTADTQLVPVGRRYRA